MRLLLLALLCAATVACKSSTATTDPDGGAPTPDAGPQLRMSRLFGPCSEDWQCPGPEGLCRRNVDGNPKGFCTRPCSDRTECDDGVVYNHCVTRQDADRAYCEQRCLNGSDCGRDGWTCYGSFPPSGGACVGLCGTDSDCGDGAACDVHTTHCVAPGEQRTEGGVTGEACPGGGVECLSGNCIAPRNGTTPTGWLDGACTSNCLLPAGYNTSNFFGDDTLPTSTCPDSAICIPQGAALAQGDLGICVQACDESSACRPGYECRKTWSGHTFTNGVCWPVDCLRTLSCPDGARCVRLMYSDGSQVGMCSRS